MDPARLIDTSTILKHKSVKVSSTMVVTATPTTSPRVMIVKVIYFFLSVGVCNEVLRFFSNAHSCMF